MFRSRKDAHLAVKYLIGPLLIILGGHSIYETIRLPPDRTSLKHVRDDVASVKVLSNRSGLIFHLKQSGDSYKLSENQPGFGKAFRIRAGDELEMLVDTWPFAESRSPEVYELIANERAIFTYEQTAEEFSDRSVSAFEIILMLIGSAMLLVPLPREMKS